MAGRVRMERAVGETTGWTLFHGAVPVFDRSNGPSRPQLGCHAALGICLEAGIGAAGDFQSLGYATGAARVDLAWPAPSAPSPRGAGAGPGIVPRPRPR